MFDSHYTYTGALDMRATGTDLDKVSIVSP